MSTCTVSGLSDGGVGVMVIPAAKEDSGGGHETWGINLSGVCVREVDQRRVKGD